jgi:hypothetical protein
MHNMFRRSLAALTLAALATALFAQSPSHAVQEARLRKITPLGGDTIKLVPENRVLSFMCSAESDKLKDSRVLNVEGKKVVQDSKGNEISNYPDDLAFRFTISSIVPRVEKEPLSYETKVGSGEFMAGIRFKLHRFEGMDDKEYDPTSAELIGVPRNVPYNERIYKVKFNTAQFSIDDRLMLEVIAADGSRLGKFHFFLK